MILLEERHAAETIWDSIDQAIDASLESVGVTARALKPPFCGVLGPHAPEKGRSADMAKDHGPLVKNDKQYEGLRKKGAWSKQRAAKIANSKGPPSGGKKGGKKSGLEVLGHPLDGRLTIHADHKVEHGLLDRPLNLGPVGGSSEAARTPLRR